MIYVALCVLAFWVVGLPLILLLFAGFQVRRHKGTALVLLGSAALMVASSWSVFGASHRLQDAMGPAGVWGLAAAAYVATLFSLLLRHMVNLRLGRSAVYPVVDTGFERALLKLAVTLLVLVLPALSVLAGWGGMLGSI